MSVLGFIGPEGSHPVDDVLAKPGIVVDLLVQNSQVFCDVCADLIQSSDIYTNIYFTITFTITNV